MLFRSEPNLRIAGAHLSHKMAAILSAVQGSVLSVEGVADAYVSENPTDTPVTIGGVAIAPYSIYVAAYGGTDADVAQAIWSKKPPGCGYTGDTTATVVDSGSGYQLPYPSYDVTFQRPAALPVYIDVTIADNGTVPSDAVAQIRNAVVAAFNGEDGGPRARIGSTLYALRFVGPIVSLGTWAQVISIAIGASASPTDPDLTVNIDQMPSLDPANISVSTA